MERRQDMERQQDMERRQDMERLERPQGIRKHWKALGLKVKVTQDMGRCQDMERCKDMERCHDMKGWVTVASYTSSGAHELNLELDLLNWV